MRRELPVTSNQEFVLEKQNPFLALLPAKMINWIRNYLIILWTQLFVFRADWYWFVIMMLLQPFTYLLFMKFLFSAAGTDAIFYIISGNVVMSISLSTMLSLGQELGWMKSEHAFDYYATLPIQKSALIFAVATRALLLSLLPVAFIIIFSTRLFDFPFTPHPAIVLAIALSGFSLSGIGAMIGFYSPNAQISSLLTQIVQPIIIFLSPVFIPVEQLPRLLQFTSHIIPTTYVARVLRDTMSGQLTTDTWLNMGVLLLITLVSAVFVDRGLDWRGRT